MPSTLFLTGELWPLQFIWHHDLRVTHCQSSAMTFVFTQYSFCSSFRQGLLQTIILIIIPYSYFKRIFKLSYAMKKTFRRILFLFFYTFNNFGFLEIQGPNMFVILFLSLKQNLKHQICKPRKIYNKIYVTDIIITLVIFLSIC